MWPSSWAVLMATPATMPREVAIPTLSIVDRLPVAKKYIDAMKPKYWTGMYA